MNKNRIKGYLISMLGLSAGDFQKSPKIYDPLYLLHSRQLKLLKNFIRQNLSGLKNLVLLDLGCGVRPYEELFDPYVSRYIGSDLGNNKDIDIACSAKEVDLPDQSCDVILALQLLEHTEDPLKVLNEINRLLVRGGCVFITIPAFFCYHPQVKSYRPGAVADNPAYPDYWRWTEAGIMKLINEIFVDREVKIEPIGGFFQCFGLQLAFLITRSVNSISKYLCYFVMFTLVPFINIISLCLDRIFYKWNRIHSAYTLFLGYAITLKK